MPFLPARNQRETGRAVSPTEALTQVMAQMITQAHGNPHGQAHAAAHMMQARGSGNGHPGSRISFGPMEELDQCPYGCYGSYGMVGPELLLRLEFPTALVRQSKPANHVTAVRRCLETHRAKRKLQPR